jgi:glycosyltransferase involved in cell wall biosynthesis
MRVLLCHQPIDGGVGRHVRDLIDGLTQAGHEVVVCSPALPDGVRASVRHERVDMRRAIAPRADLAALARLVALLRELRPDVVHAHSSKAGALARVARVAVPGVPVLYTPHGYAFAGHFSSDVERRVYRGVERALSPLATRVVCVCEAEAKLARAVGAGSRVRVVHNGIATSDGATAATATGPAGTAAPGNGASPQPRLAELAREGPVIGALTLLRPGKGLETLIEATPRVLARHPRAQIAIVGDGPGREELGALARSLSVERAVHFLGSCSDPLGALGGMDVFVHPSWAESFPYVILEAMSLARPIVASDVGGIPEALVHGESGLLTPARDERALAGALIELLARFTREAMVERLVRVYEEVARPTARAGERGARGPLLAAAERRSLREHD